MTAAVTLRRARVEDAAVLCSLGKRTFLEAFAPHNRPEDCDAYVAATFSPAIQRAELEDRKVEVLLADVDGISVGYAKLIEKAAPPSIDALKPLCLERLYVESAFHGRGVAAALMDACLGRRDSGGHDALWLGVWERNHRARAFYEKYRFERVGTMAYVLGSDVQTDDVLVKRR